MFILTHAVYFFIIHEIYRVYNGIKSYSLVKTQKILNLMFYFQLFKLIKATHHEYIITPNHKINTEDDVVRFLFISRNKYRVNKIQFRHEDDNTKNEKIYEINTDTLVNNKSKYNGIYTATVTLSDIRENITGFNAIEVETDKRNFIYDLDDNILKEHLKHLDCVQLLLVEDVKDSLIRKYSLDNTDFHDLELSQYNSNSYISHNIDNIDSQQKESLLSDESQPKIKNINESINHLKVYDSMKKKYENYQKFECLPYNPKNQKNYLKGDKLLENPIEQSISDHNFQKNKSLYACNDKEATNLTTHDAIVSSYYENPIQQNKLNHIQENCCIVDIDRYNMRNQYMYAQSEYNKFKKFEETAIIINNKNKWSFVNILLSVLGFILGMTILIFLLFIGIKIFERNY